MAATTYQTAYWKMLKEDRGSRREDFFKHLLGIARPVQIAYTKIMRQHDGNPSWVEYRSTTRDAWAFVLPDVSAGKGWRIQYFDLDSFQSHACFASLEEAVQSMIREGFVVEDKGTLDRLSVTPRWQRGVAVSQIINLVNRQEISWEEANRRFAELPKREEVEA